MSRLIRLRFGASIHVGLWRRPDDGRRDGRHVHVDSVGLLLQEGGGGDGSWSRVLFWEGEGWVPSDWVRRIP